MLSAPAPMLARPKKRPGARSLCQDRRGASAIEFALLSIPTLLLVTGVFEFGRFIFIQNGLQAGCERASRYVYANSTAPLNELQMAIPDLVKDGATGIKRDDITVATSTTTSDDVDYIQITATYNFAYLGMLDYADLVIKGQLVVPVE